MPTTKNILVDKKELTYFYVCSMLFLGLVLIPLFVHIHTSKALAPLADLISLLWLLGLLLAGIICHELLHALAFILVGVSPKKIRFGFGSYYIYTHAHQWLSRERYIFVLLLPALILGAGPYLISLYTGNIFIFVWSFLMLRGAGGDLIIVIKCLRATNRNSLVRDHPVSIGCETWDFNSSPTIKAAP